MRDLMIDIETMGKSPNGAIIAIGAVFFDIRTGETKGRFSLPVDLESAQELGMEIDASTVLWWFNQSVQAISMWNTKQNVTLQVALEEFIAWYGRNAQNKTSVWANAPTFDLDIMRNAFRLANLGTPWHFKQERCVRTLVQLARDMGYNPRMEPRNSLAHSAIDDCEYQIQYCCKAWSFIMKGESV